MCLNAGGMGRQDVETETLIPTNGGHFGVAHSLRGEGFDASEDGTGRGTPLVPVAYGVGEQPDVGHCLRSGASKADKHESTTYVAQPTLRASMGGGTTGNHWDGQVVVQPVAFNARQDPDSWADRTGPLDTDGGTQAVAIDTYNQTVQDTAHTIRAGAGMEGVSATYAAMQVRRLTPRECERLQGFPDDYTLVPNRGKPAADGPRYKALGNSMAVPVMRWIGERIQGVHQ
jgi:DNA (cytosine-5)-methyltransferase 1